MEVANPSVVAAPPEWVPLVVPVPAPLEAVTRAPAPMDAQLRAALPQRVCPRRLTRTRPPPALLLAVALALMTSILHQRSRYGCGSLVAWWGCIPTMLVIQRHTR